MTPDEDAKGATESMGPHSVRVDRYRQILDTAPDAMIVLDLAGIISFANLQTENLFGYSRADLLGKPLETLIPERYRGVHANHLATYFAKPSTRHMGSGLSLFGRRADGSEMDIEVSLSPVYGNGDMLVCAAIRDISERKRIEGMVKVGSERLSSAVESIQDAFALFDSNDQLVLCNSVYRALLGRAEGPIVGRSYPELLDLWLVDLAFQDQAARAAFRSARIAERSAPTVTFGVCTLDGRSFRVSDRRTAEGGVVTTVWDLTEDEQQAEELRQARAAAEAGSAAKSDFLSSMSHELRTPLNAILGFAQLLRRDKKEPLSQRHRERADHILKGGEHLLRLIDDILDLSRIEAGGVSISPEPVDVDNVLEEVVATLQPAAARADVTLSVAPRPTSLAVSEVSTDRTRFVQILMNYGSNAIKYNRPGGTVTFEVTVPSDTHVRVTVADTGMGIPFDKQDKVFLPFQRAGQETGPIEGTGIGLAITKRLAELLDGSVGFHSVAGQGSTFWVEMPMHASSVPSANRVPRQGESSQLEADRRGTVLYIEDNPANVVFMQDLLGSFEGIELTTAPTAEMGVQLARARLPDVILMDINLPGMSGFDALKILKDWSETRAIPVIALTAAASERDRQRGERSGFFRYLTKPVKVDELEAALELLLRR